MDVDNALTGVRVLVVEDNDDLRELYAIWLERSGAMVTQAARATEAFERLRLAPPPDVILCDLHMPGMDGCGFLTQLRARPGFEHVPVVAVTGSESETALMRTLEAGFTAHLVKPVTDEALEAQVKRALGR